MSDPKPKTYYLKVTNPQDGTYYLLKDISIELNLKFEEHWQKQDDEEIKIHTRPVYSRHFDHVVQLFSSNKCDINFSKYLIHEYIMKVEKFEGVLQTEDIR